VCRAEISVDVRDVIHLEVARNRLQVELPGLGSIKWIEKDQTILIVEDSNVYRSDDRRGEPVPPPAGD